VPSIERVCGVAVNVLLGTQTWPLLGCLHELNETQAGGPNQAAKSTFCYLSVIRNRKSGNVSFSHHDDVASSLTCHLPPERLEDLHHLSPAEPG
jgi:hypothetical protein